MAKILVIGTLMVDVIAPFMEGFKRGANYIVDISLCFGGGGGNVAYYLAGLGDEVGLVGGLGRDPLGYAYEGYLKELGVNLYLARGSTTGTVIGLTFEDGERSFLAQPGSNADIKESLVTDAIKDFDPDAIVLHGYLLPIPQGRRALLTAIDTAYRRGVEAVFDPAYYNMNRGELEVAIEIMKKASVITPNELEMRTLAEERDPLKAASKISTLYGLAVYLKRGYRGAALITHGKILATSQPPHVKAINTVGSGDAFTAVVAHGLAHGWDPIKTLHTATYIAAQTVACKCPQCLKKDHITLIRS